MFAVYKSTMKESERIEKQKELIETIGRYLDRQGYPPVAGRILGLLMVTDKEEYTFDEIVEGMQISKSSVSNALKNLELRNAIEYVTYPCDRKRYFRISFSDINFILEETQQKFTSYAEFLDKVVSLKKNPNSKNAVLCKKISDGAKFFLSTIEEFKNQLKE